MHSRGRFSGLIALPLLLALLGCGEEPTEVASPPVAPPPPPHISGRAVFTGPEPTAIALPMRSVDPTCAELWEGTTDFPPVRLGEVVPTARDSAAGDWAAGDSTTDEVGADRRGLADVFVYLKDAPREPQEADPAPAEPVVMAARGCFYDPPVVGLRMGQTLVLENVDPTLHQPRAAGESAPFRFQLPFEGMRSEIRFDQPHERVEVRCGSHPWMRGHVGVMEHRWFAVTDEDGRFELRDPPKESDRWVVAAWHPTLGDLEMTAARGDSDLVLEFGSGSV